MIWLLILQLAGATAPAPTTPPPPSGMDNFRTLFSVDDYPVEAMKNGWQGDVTVELKVDVSGRPASCRIVQSSGYTILDAKSCEIMMTRARFQPAKDSAGNPVEDTVRFPPISWKIEAVGPPK